MKLYGKYGMGNLFKIILKIGFVVLFLLLVFFIQILNMFEIYMNWFLGMIYISGIFFLGLIYQFINLFDSLMKNTPFCVNTVTSLRKGMVLSLIIFFFVFLSLGMIVFCYDYYTLGVKICVLFIGILFFGVGIALYILKELFRQATIYKEENDLTI